MGVRTSLVLGGLAAAALTVTLTACSDPGDLEISNNGPGDVTVLTGDEEATVSADGGVVFLDYGCTPGDVTVEFSAGETVVVSGPVCPDQRVVIGDGTVELRPVSAGDN